MKKLFPPLLILCLFFLGIFIFTPDVDAALLDWTQVNTNGFGDSNNNGYEIAGTKANNGNIYFATDNSTSGTKLYVCDPVGAPGSSCSDTTGWTQANTAGFGNSNTHSLNLNAIGSFSINSIDYLYMGTNTPANGGDIVRCDESTGCDAPSEFFAASSAGMGIGTPANQPSVQSFEVLGNYMYVGVKNTVSDVSIYRCDTTVVGGCDATGPHDDGDWDLVTSGGIGSANENIVADFETVNVSGTDYLYAATKHGTLGPRIYRMNPATDCDGTVTCSWTQVNYDDFESGGGQNNGDPLTMRVFNGHIVVTTENITYGGQVWACNIASTSCDAGDDWLEYAEFGGSLSGLIGDADNDNVLLFDEYNGELWAGVTNGVDGARIFKTNGTDLNDWQPVSGFGFDDSTNNIFVWPFATGSVFAAAAHGNSGVEIWETSGSETSPIPELPSSNIWKILIAVLVLGLVVGIAAFMKKKKNN